MSQKNCHNPVTPAIAYLYFMSSTFSNRLQYESSPYLQQHAHNPVDWYPWSEEALALSKTLDKPILVSIGYAACHWCHVMERESFEDEKVAAYMNEHFINIKIDREERPDLDHIYMDAVQAIAGNGGWPLNVFLTTDAKPFYGGTYFPPQNAYNRPSWKHVLESIHDAWINRRDELEEQANSLVEHISRSGSLFSTNIITGSDLSGEDTLFTREQCDLIAENLLKMADKEQGGFGMAPKFPQTFSIQYLLAYGYFFDHAPSMVHAEFSLQQMLNGGIYDQLAGGLARYSTDNDWLVPHFEKMLYDNALLVSVLADAFQATGKKVYADAIHKTLGFFLTEMKSKEAGIYAALDADSEGVEGRFYVWDKAEVEGIIGDDAGLYCKWFGISEKGNWEGKNILHIRKSKETFAKENNIPVGSLDELIERANRKLLEVRNRRPRPLTDDKILLGWNALFITALCKASAALGHEGYRKSAMALFGFIKSRFSKEGRVCYHTYKNGQAKYPAFLDDYAYLIQACIHLQEVSSDQDYLLEAKTMTEYVIDHFESSESGYFYYTGKSQDDIITRKAEFYDGAVPSGNSVMAENLFYLSLIYDKKEWLNKARTLTKNITPVAVKYPSSFAVWAINILKQWAGINELVITGRSVEELRTEILMKYMPNKVFQSSSTPHDFPLLQHKNYEREGLIYHCKNYRCESPVDKINDLKLLFKNQIN